MGIQKAPSIHVYVDGEEVRDAVSVDDRAMTVDTLAKDEDGHYLLSSDGSEVVTRRIAAIREVRITRETR